MPNHSQKRFEMRQKRKQLQKGKPKSSGFGYGPSKKKMRGGVKALAKEEPRAWSSMEFTLNKLCPYIQEKINSLMVLGKSEAEINETVRKIVNFRVNVQTRYNKLFN